jgi:hypothetical protein
MALGEPLDDRVRAASVVVLAAPRWFARIAAPRFVDHPGLGAAGALHLFGASAPAGPMRPRSGRGILTGVSRSIMLAGASTGSCQSRQRFMAGRSHGLNRWPGHFLKTRSPCLLLMLWTAPPPGT